METLLGSLADLLYPRSCPFCDLAPCSPGAPHCGACEAILPPLPEFRCIRCDLSLPDPWSGLGSLSPWAEASPLCGLCATGGPSFDSARTAASYEGPVLRAIQRLKYAGRREHAAPLASWFVRRVARRLPPATYDCVLPVPLHQRRLAERGFNQAALLAPAIARRLGAAITITFLERRRDTPPQTQLSRTARRRSIRGAFAVRRAEAVRGRTVLLVDDVFTTGATVSECARVLRRAGASRVDVATLARVMG